MYPIDGPSLNLKIADLRHLWVGALRFARQLNGVAVNGTGRKLDGVVGSTPATAKLKSQCEIIKRLTKCSSIMDRILRVILEQNLLRGPSTEIFIFCLARFERINALNDRPTNGRPCGV